MIVTVTGHRPVKLGGYNTPNPVYDAVREAIDRALMDVRPDILYTGMAIGVDQWAAELCIFNDIPFIAALPFVDSDNKWPPYARAHFRQLCSLAKKVEIVTPTVVYNPMLMQVRNEYMVRHSDLVLAVWNGGSGGTKNCVNYAKSIGKEVRLLDIPKEVWVDAAAIESNISETKNKKDYDRQLEEAFKMSALRQAQNAAINPETIFGSASSESFSSLRNRVISSLVKEDELAPKRKVEL